MPILYSSNDNEDKSAKLSLELRFLGYDLVAQEKWLNYQIIFRIGSQEYMFKSRQKQAQTFLGTIGEIGKFAFVVEPVNEVQTLADDLEKFLSNNRASYTFQPADPSFELVIERLHNPLTQIDEFKIYCWVDAGNTNQLEYSWDGIGVRFLTSKTLLQTFRDELVTQVPQH